MRETTLTCAAWAAQSQENCLNGLGKLPRWMECWTPTAQPYQHHRDQGNFDVPLVPHVDFRWSVGIAFQPSFSTSFPSYLIPWVAGIFESRVAEETVAPKKSPDLACLAILRKRQPSERLRQDKSYDTVLIDWNVCIYLRGVQFTK